MYFSCIQVNDCRRQFVRIEIFLGKWKHTTCTGLWQCLNLKKYAIKQTWEIRTRDMEAQLQQSHSSVLTHYLPISTHSLLGTGSHSTLYFVCTYIILLVTPLPYTIAHNKFVTMILPIPKHSGTNQCLKYLPH